MQVPNYMQIWGVARSLGADVRTFSLRPDQAWEPDWQELERAVTRETRLVYLSNPNNPTGSVLSDAAMQRIVDRCEQTGHGCWQTKSTWAPRSMAREHRASGA